MKKITLIFTLTFIVFGCGSKRKIITKKSETKTEQVTIPESKKEVEEITEDVPMKPLVINSITEYIEVYKDIAIDEMNKYKIPASITLAQGILESGSGKGRLAVKANNHFGIKCHGWKGKKIYHDDDKSQECFRKYSSAEKSFTDHSEFLAKRKRYAKLFALKITDYRGWAKELRRAGYATDKKYPQKLISLIERYELFKYDNKENNQKSNNDEVVVQPNEHVVGKGDTIYSISKQYNLSVDYIQKLNGLKTTEISIGQIIYLKRRE